MKNLFYIYLLSISSIIFISCSSGTTPKVSQEIIPIKNTGEVQEQNNDNNSSLNITQNTQENKISQDTEETTEAIPTPEYLDINKDGSNLMFKEILADDSMYTRYQISYQSEGFTISGIMNIPKGEGNFPLIILNHGYINPAVYTLGRGLKREQDYFARNGFAVLHTDYRNHAFSDTDETLQGTGSILRSKKYGADAINAILAVQKAKMQGVQELQYVESESIGMLGHSMGGGVTMFALVAAQELLDAAILYAPVHSNEWYNYKRWREDSLSDTEKQALENIYGDLENPLVFKDISPETYFSRIETPVQMYFGTLDKSCPIEWGDDIQNAFSKNDKDLEYIIYEGEKHEFIPKFGNFMNSATEFFQENLEI